MSRRLVVEADGGSRGNPGPAAYGAVVRDADTGEVLAELAETIGTATNNVAEYRGLIAGLHAAHEIDPSAQVAVRMDSKLVIEQMAGRWQVKHPSMRPLAQQARAAHPGDRISWTWIPRAQNAHADRLLNAALDGKLRRSVLGPAADAGPPRVDEAEVEPAALTAPPPPTGWVDLGPPTTLVLLRHGETTMTAERRFSGSGGADPGLTELGREQAVRAAAALAARGEVDAVVTSPMRRARETAAVAADELGLEVTVDDDLRETAFGAWDGRTFAEVRAGWPAEHDRWVSSPEVAPPGGESAAEVAVRVAHARDRLLADHPRRTVLVVTHVTPVKTLVRLALDAPAHAVYRMELRPASLTEIAYYADGIASLRAYNVVPPG